MSESHAPVCVLLDTNIWRSDLLLRTTLGAAVLHAIQRSDSRIGLPEVVEGELRRHLVEAGTDAVDAANRALETLQRLTGETPNIDLPTEDELAAKVDERLGELESLIDRVPFSLEHARKSLERVQDKIAPNGPKNQQFKDSVIWEVALDLAQERPVLLITADKAFYEARDPRRGLAAVLQREADARRVAIHAYPNLAGAAEHLRESVPPLDKDAVAGRISSALADEIAKPIEDNSFEVVRLAAHDLNAFATEDHRLLSIAFELRYEIVDSAPDGVLRDGRAEVTGTCGYRPDQDEVLDVALSEVILTWVNPDGSEGRGVPTISAWGRLTLVPGRRFPSASAYRSSSRS